MTSRHEARSARKADGDGHEGRCIEGREWRRTLRSILELKLLERRGLAALTLAWSGRRGGRGSGKSALRAAMWCQVWEAHQEEGP